MTAQRYANYLAAKRFYKFNSPLFEGIKKPSGDSRLPDGTNKKIKKIFITKKILWRCKDTLIIFPIIRLG